LKKKIGMAIASHSGSKTNSHPPAGAHTSVDILFLSFLFLFNSEYFLNFAANN
jgi:hypothetical protein